MIKSSKITYKVFLFERVKKKVRLFDTETYPVQIRLTSGIRTLYMRSHFFAILQQNKYRQEILQVEPAISVDDIISGEEKLIQYILDTQITALSIDTLRQVYALLSHDILHELDELFKLFMIDFFREELLPAYSLFIKNDGVNHTSEFILHNLEKSLQPDVYRKLLQSAVTKAPPYIPLISFFRKEMNSTLPVFPVYLWQQKYVAGKFHVFVNSVFPEYEASAPLVYVNKMVEHLPKTGICQ